MRQCLTSPEASGKVERARQGLSMDLRSCSHLPCSLESCSKSKGDRSLRLPRSCHYLWVEDAGSLPTSPQLCLGSSQGPYLPT